MLKIRWKSLVTVVVATASLGFGGHAQAQAPLIVNSSSSFDVSCNGGSNGFATVEVSGGTPDYSYSWSPTGGTRASASGLLAGNYTVTVTDSTPGTAQVVTQSYTLGEPPALVASPSAQTNVSVNGGNDGSATVSVSGGTPGYTYVWAPSGGGAATASGLTAGTYTVTATDNNGCQTTQSFTLTQPGPTVSPVVSSVTPPPPATYTLGQNLDFVVNFDQTVNVVTTGGVPSLSLTVGAAPRSAVYQSGSGTASLTFRYTVLSGDADNDGVTVGSLSTNGGTIRNATSQDATLTLNSVGSTTAVLVDGAPPAPVPTLSEWAMILFIGLLALAGAALIGRRQRLFTAA